MSDRIIHITLDPPYRLGDDQADVKLVGWCEIEDQDNPNIRVTANGVPAPYKFKRRPDVEHHFPDLKATGFAVRLIAPEILKSVDTMQDQGGFLLNIRVQADDRERTFEYAVSEGWLRAVFGQELRPYPVPPEHLQIRVTGAAAGGYVQAGRVVADQIEAILRDAGVAFPESGTVYDFGCGPGRVVSALAPRHPQARYIGSDIDSEATDWCAANLGHFGRFFANGHAPPLDVESASVDLIYSISIFTHLPEDMQNLWLAELRRVLKPGGILLTTKLNPFAYDIPEAVKEAARQTGYAFFGDAAATDGLPDFYRLAYHTDDYVRRVWGEHFEVLHIGSHDLNNTQDAVLLRARS